MNSVGVHEAKTQLSKLLKRVGKGEQFTIIRYGIPVARLVPPDRAAEMSATDAVAELKRLREGCKLNGLSVRSMIEEGRRF
jgi:prevent-host-death family protein